MITGYPNINEKVFISGDYENMSHIPKSFNGNHGELLDRYYNGFRDLANVGVEYVKSNSYDNAIKDRFIFPILYNYRHFLELILKKYAIKYGKDKVDLNNLGHNLKFYWDIVKPVLSSTYASEENIDEVIKATENYIIEFHELDKSSMKFRYPFAKGESLAPSFDVDVGINVINLRKRMDELYNLLEYLEDSIDAQQE